jgi:hypothetical protein
MNIISLVRHARKFSVKSNDINTLSLTEVRMCMRKKIYLALFANIADFEIVGCGIHFCRDYNESRY